MTIANVAVTFFLLGATMVLTPFVFAMAMGWIGENGKAKIGEGVSRVKERKRA